MERLTKKSIKPIVEQKEKEMRCNCDLDNWEPDTRTGHSWVCRIHNAAIAEWNKLNKSTARV